MSKEEVLDGRIDLEFLDDGSMTFVLHAGEYSSKKVKIPKQSVVGMKLFFESEVD